MTLTATFRRRLAAVPFSATAAPRPTRRPLLAMRLFLSLLVAVGLAGGARGQGQAPPWGLAVANGSPQPTPDQTNIAGVATDAAGNVFVTGSFFGTVTFDGLVLTNAGPAGSSDVFVAKWDVVTGTYTWAVSVGGTGNDTGYGIAVSGANVYVTGGFDSAGRAELGGLVLVGQGNYDMFVAKLIDTSTGHTPATSSVATGWAATGGGMGYDVGRAIAVQGVGVYVAGQFATGAGARIGGQVLSGNGGDDLFVVKYLDTSTGSTPATSSVANGWVRTDGGTGDDAARALAVQGTGVYVTGAFGSGGASFAGQVVRGAIPSAFFVAKYLDTSTASTPAGSSVANGWATGGGVGGVSYGQGIAVQGQEVFVTGSFEGYPAIVAGQALTTAGLSDMFVAKYIDMSTGNTPATQRVANGWATSGGGAANDYGGSVAVRGHNVYVTGGFAGGGTTRMAGRFLNTVGGQDVFLAKYVDTSTNLTPAASSYANAWATSGGSTGYDVATGVAVSGQRVYVVGSVSSAATFGLLPLSPTPSVPVTLLAGLTDPTLPLAARPATAPLPLTLAPNPAYGTAQVRGTAPGTTLTLRDALGRELRTATADAGGAATLRLDGLAAGVYVVLGGGQVGRLVVE